jgi:predicted lipid-binding transport protein (Tim44 family)
MLKKLMMVVMALTLLFAFTAHGSVDAKGYRSGVKTHTTIPNKSTTTDHTTKPNSGSTTGSTSSAGTTANRGFFSGGSFMKGLMIGGLSGLLFGSLFSGMGGFGNLLGLVINILAIYIVIRIVASLFRYFSRPRKPDPRDGRY